MAFTADDLRDELAEAAWRAQHPIRVEPGKLAQIATEGERVLLEAGIPFFSHGEALNRPVVDEVEATKGRKAKIARFAPVTTDMLRDYLSRCAHWVRFNERKKDFVATDPPRDVAATILSRTGEWQFPHTVGVITTPTLRPDGNLNGELRGDALCQMIE